MQVRAHKREALLALLGAGDLLAAVVLGVMCLAALVLLVGSVLPRILFG